MLQMPNGTQMIKNISADRRKRLRDVHAFIVNHFRTLNAIHTRILQDQSNQEQVFSVFFGHKKYKFLSFNILTYHMSHMSHMSLEQ